MGLIFSILVNLMINLKCFLEKRNLNLLLMSKIEEFLTLIIIQLEIKNNLLLQHIHQGEMMEIYF